MPERRTYVELIGQMTTRITLKSSKTYDQIVDTTRSYNDGDCKMLNVFEERENSELNTVSVNKVKLEPEISSN